MLKTIDFPKMSFMENHEKILVIREQSIVDLENISKINCNKL